jgi:hypothetical protein
MCNVDHAATQRIHRENADHILFAIFVSVLTGVVGSKCVFKPHGIFDSRFPFVLQAKGLESIKI